MQPVIIATDFTDVAQNAAHYACNLAIQYNSPITVMHSYTIPITFHENPMPVVSLEEGKSIADAQMDKLVADLRKQYPGLAITDRVVYGDITDNIKDIVAKVHPWIVIVGNSSGDDSGFWLGSNLLSTLRNVSCPVLAVPPEYKYKKVEKIAFACDFMSISDWLPAKELIRLVENARAELHIINVDQERKDLDDESAGQWDFKESLKHIYPSYHYLDNEDIEEAIQDFVTGNYMDWLIVIPHKHSFFESLFHKSQTKEIVKSAHVPILALHEKE